VAQHAIGARQRLQDLEMVIAFHAEQLGRLAGLAGFARLGARGLGRAVVPGAEVGRPDSADGPAILGPGPLPTALPAASEVLTVVPPSELGTGVQAQ